jgi:hypothetical protein
MSFIPVSYSFMRNFKVTLKKLKHGMDFWDEVKGRNLGLLSRDDLVEAGVPNPVLSVTEDDKKKVKKWDLPRVSFVGGYSGLTV